MSAILWINLFLCTVGGGILFYYITGNPILGIIIGIICGILINIIGGGFIATIINIDKNLEKLLPKNNSNINIDLNGSYKSMHESIQIREKPNLASKVLFKLEYNEIFSIIEIGEKCTDTDYWVCVKTKDGKTGWVGNSKYLEKFT
jgi:uncharacterized protein YgiM (DUF1202 family)